MGGAQPWAWAGVKHGTGEAVTDCMALARQRAGYSVVAPSAYADVDLFARAGSTADPAPQ